MNKYIDRIRLRGDVQIEIHDQAGHLLRRMAMRNTITYAGMNSILYLWSQDTGVATDWRIVKLVPGRSGTPPTVGDLAMGDPVSSGDQINLVGANRQVVPLSGELLITGTLTSGQAAGQTLQEIGLVLGNTSLFARQVHPPIAKPPVGPGAFSVTYTWQLGVTT